MTVTLHRHNQLGLSLIELLIGISLGAVLLTAVVQIITNNKQNIVLADAFSEVQESGRLAMELLSRDFRMIGFQGCLNTVDSTKTKNHLDASSSGYDSFLHDYSKPVDIYSNSTPSVKIGNVTPRVSADFDIIITRGATSTDINLMASPNTSAFTFQVAGPSSQLDVLTAGNIVTISNCETSDLFALTTVAGTTTKTLTYARNTSNSSSTPPLGPDNISNTLEGGYDSGDKLWLMNSTTYFVAPSGVYGNNVLSLYKYSELLGNNAIELVPFINRFDLKYGISSNGDKSVDKYVDVGDASITDLSNQLISIKITLDIKGDTKLEGNTSLNRSYTRVVQLRNSKLGID